MLPTQRWASGQKATPSFISMDDQSMVLQQPMPADLQRYASPQGGPQSPKSARHTPRATSAGPSSRGGGSTRRGNIHEDLLERGRLYQQRQEALQEKAIAQEMSRCRSVPRISKMGRELNRSEKIVPRLHKIALQKERMQAFKQQELVMRDTKIIDEYFKPKLSRKGCRSQGKTMQTQHEMWNQRKLDKLETLKAERIASQLEDVHDTPDINARSEQLAAKRREREGMAGYSHYEAMIERDRLSKLARWEQRETQFARENPGTPRITHQAAMINADCDVSERLHRSARAKEEHLQQLQKKFAEEDLRRSGLSPAPKVGESQASEFLERHEDYRKRHDDRMSEIREMERRAHTPKINAVSEAIASSNPRSTVERLSTPRRKATTLMTSPGASVTPRPVYGGASSTPASALRYEAAGGNSSSASALSPVPMVAHESTPTPRKVDTDSLRTYERMVAAESRRQERLNKVREDLERKELEECTFSPETGTTWTSNLKPSTTYERTMQWAKRRDEKLALERSQQQKMETDFSFAPDMVSGEGVYDTSTGFVPAGFDAFVNRQESAREKRYQEPQPGQWTPQRTTVPEEFHLGASQGAIQALNKPLPAPLHTPQAAATTPTNYAAPRPHMEAPQNVAYNLASNLISQDRKRYEYSQPPPEESLGDNERFDSL